MTHTFKLARRAARLRAPLLVTLLALTFGACDSADRLTDTTAGDFADPTTIADPAAPATTEDAALADSLAQLDAAADPSGGQASDDFDDDGLGDEETIEIQAVSGAEQTAGQPAEGLALASVFRGGIPFGTFHLPTYAYGAVFNGNITVISPPYLMSALNQARRTGTRIVVSFTGNDRHYKNANGTFSLAKWKARVARYRGMALASYINDKTLLAHYLVDEPNDPSNWNGTTISRATLDEMARYSKSLFPTLPTAVRAAPKYLRGYNYRYLDAGWAQYHSRFKDPKAWLAIQVRDAKLSGLALIVGVNILAGGTPGGMTGFYPGSYAMTATQLRNWGGALLADPYACAFLGWQYNTRYLSRLDIRSAMVYLSAKARARPIKSCRGT
jgi:hypothetical protein